MTTVDNRPQIGFMANIAVAAKTQMEKKGRLGTARHRKLAGVSPTYHGGVPSALPTALGLSA